MIRINFPKKPNNMFKPSSVLFHIINYFNFDVRMNRMPFLVIILALMVLSSVYIQFLLPAELIEKLMNEPVEAAKDFTRTQIALVEAYYLLFIPALCKRMKDADFSSKRIEIVLAALYGPIVLKAFASEALIHIVAVPLFALALFIYMVMVSLLFIEGTQGDNKYGESPHADD